MPHESLAVKLLETYAREGSFDVDYGDPSVTENVAKHLIERGCIVTVQGAGTRLHVVCPKDKQERAN